MPETSEEPRDQDAPAGEDTGGAPPSEESPETGAEAAPEAAAASDQEPDAAPASDEGEAAAGAEEAAPEETAEAAADEGAAGVQPQAEEEPLTPKQRRKLERSRAGGPPRPQLSLAERLQERGEARARKAAQRRRWRKSKRARTGATDVARPEPPAAEGIVRRGKRKVRQGVVVSNKADKTITVRIDLVRAHPVYGKVVRESSTLHAHDERNQAREGDVVRVMECRPLSRMKRWRLVDVLEKAR
jgi:small subunit ribosomal protein S17